MLRYSKASHLIDENVSVYDVRDFLGHVSISTTQVYLKSNRARMRSVIASAADSTVMPTAGYYDGDKKAELLSFLETLL